jgi:hypothetical protein
MTEPGRRPKRNRRPSHRLFGQAIPTDSDESDDFMPEHPGQHLSTTIDNGGLGPPPSSAGSSPAPSNPSLLLPASLHRTPSTTSIVSTSSLVSDITSAKSDDDKRRSNFDERYKTATSTEEEVLRKFFFPLCFERSLIIPKRSRCCHGLQMYTNISACHPPSV